MRHFILIAEEIGLRDSPVFRLLTHPIHFSKNEPNESQKEHHASLQLYLLESEDIARKLSKQVTRLSFIFNKFRGDWFKGF